VVTSRIVTLHEDLGRLARSIRLGTWDDATCRAHFREVVPALAREPDADLDRLARRVGGLPLAVRLLAKQLLRPGVDPRSLAERLDREPLTALDSAARGAERTVVATFQSALDGLGDAERRVLHALAACAPATRAEVVAAVAGVREADAALALEGLAEQSLVEWLPDAEQPFRLHDVVRLLVSSLPGAQEAAAAHDAWALERVAAHRAAGAWRALDREVAEVLAVVDHRLHRGDAPGAWQALATILGALDRRGMFGELVAAATRVLAAVPPDSIEAAALLGNLGIAWCSLGEIAKATANLERALSIADARRWPEGQALALGGLGRCQSALGRWAEAIASHQRAAAIHQRLGQQRSLAESLGNIGLAYRRSGDVNKAVEHLEDALAIYEELPPLEGRAEVLGGLGLCFRDIGELAGAVDYFQRALAIHETLGGAGGQATMLGNLGNAYRSLGDKARAVENLERALALYTDLGQLDGQGVALGNLGACYQAAGDKARGREYFERARDTLRRAGLPDDHPHLKMVLGALGRRSGGKTDRP
jgi:tetratricopeptide (TPR) repeat protein